MIFLIALTTLTWAETPNTFCVRSLTAGAQILLNGETADEHTITLAHKAHAISFEITHKNYDHFDFFVTLGASELKNESFVYLVTSSDEQEQTSRGFAPSYKLHQTYYVMGNYVPRNETNRMLIEIGVTPGACKKSNEE